MELILPPGCDPKSLPLPRDPTGRPLLDVVTVFKACLGVPRHPTNSGSSIDESLLPVAGLHDSLLDSVSVISDEDPFVAL